MKCEYCGTINNDNDTICKGCGAKVVKESILQQEQVNPNTEQNLSNHIPNSWEPKKATSPILIVLAILVSLGTMSFAGYRAYTYFQDVTAENAQKEKDNGKEFIDDDGIIEQSDYKRVGSAEYGYIDIPKAWVVFKDVNNYEVEMMQYSDSTGTEILTMSANVNPSITAKESATNVLNAMISDGAINTDGATVTVYGYTAYQVYGYYEDLNVWVCTWSFIDSQGILHYIALESPDGYSDIFDLIDTYNTNK